MGNAHRLCGDEGFEQQALRKLRGCHVENVDALMKVRPRKVMKSCGAQGPSQEKILKDLVPT